MRSRSLRYALSALPAALLIFAATATAAPAPTQILSVSPPVIDLPGFYAPGSTVTPRTIKVTNRSPERALIRIQAHNFVAGGERGEPKLVQEGDPDFLPNIALSRFIHPSITEFFLDPAESREVSFEIRLPNEVEPGGRYGVIQFINTATPDSQVSVRNSVGTLVMLRVAGAVKESGRVESLQAYVVEEDSGERVVRRRVRFVDPMERRPITFETRFKNTGNVHYKPSGTVRVKTLLGAEDKLRLPENNVLPGSVRAETVEWGRLPFVGVARAQASFTFGVKNPQTAGSETIYLIFFPWRLALIVLIVTLVLAALLTYLTLRFIIRPRVTMSPPARPNASRRRKK